MGLGRGSLRQRKAIRTTNRKGVTEAEESPRIMAMPVPNVTSDGNDTAVPVPNVTSDGNVTVVLK